MCSRMVVLKQLQLPTRVVKLIGMLEFPLYFHHLIYWIAVGVCLISCLFNSFTNTIVYIGLLYVWSAAFACDFSIGFLKQWKHPSYFCTAEFSAAWTCFSWVVLCYFVQLPLSEHLCFILMFAKFSGHIMFACFWGQSNVVFVSIMHSRLPKSCQVLN